MFNLTHKKRKKTTLNYYMLPKILAKPYKCGHGAVC